MDAVERLSLDEAAAPTLLGVTHVHRYELAAELCAGKRVLDLCCGSGYGSKILSGRAASVVGVDIDAPSVESARAAFADVAELSFECADAHAYLERSLDDFDAIVLLEGLEHLPEPVRALARLRDLAAAGALLVVSLPNSRAFGERNPHHVTDYDYERAMEAVRGFPRATVLYQFHAEGSLIRGGTEGDLDSRAVLDERADVEHANHFIVVANAGADATIPSSSRMQLAVAPAFNSYILELERFNRELWRTNQRLARDRVGVADSAAAAVLAPGESRTRGIDAVATAVVRAARFVVTVVLTVLPHGLTMVITGIRARMREQRPR